MNFYTHKILLVDIKNLIFESSVMSIFSNIIKNRLLINIVGKKNNGKNV